MIPKCDILAYHLENHEGLFASESEEAQERYLKRLNKLFKTTGMSSIFIPERLKFLVKRFTKKAKRK